MLPARNLGDNQSATESTPASAGLKRRYRSKQERRRIVEETLAPGASVARVARVHEVNANQVFYWRRLYQQGLLDDGTSTATLVPVQLSDTAPPQSAPLTASPAPPARQQRGYAPASGCGSIQIEAGRVRLQIEGAADPATLRVVLGCLLG